MNSTLRRGEASWDAQMVRRAAGTGCVITAFPCLLRLFASDFWGGEHSSQGPCQAAMKSLFSLTVSFLQNPGGRIPQGLQGWNAAAWSLCPTALERLLWRARAFTATARSLPRLTGSVAPVTAPRFSRLGLSWGRNTRCS